jgi:polar amino acid transport system substrate-binding protein
MRKIIIAVAGLAIVGSACSKSSTGGSPTTTASAGTFATAAECAKQSTIPYISAGKLTIGTDNPAFQPWFGGTGTYGPWKAHPDTGTGNPASHEGYESAVAYAIADQLGLTDDQIQWVPISFNESYKPGPKSFDFDINEVSYNTARATVVTFSDSYYDAAQALVVKKDSPYATAKSFSDLKGAKLGAQVGTTSYNYIVDNIQPTQQPSVYDTSTAVLAAFNAGQIDGFVVDAPTAYVSVLIGEAKNGTVAGQFPQIGSPEYFGLVFQKGNTLAACVNQAIAALTDNGTLSSLQSKWLKDVTFPVIQQ